VILVRNSGIYASLADKFSLERKISMRCLSLLLVMFLGCFRTFVDASPYALIQSIDHVTVTVTDLEQSRHFYETLLGLEEAAAGFDANPTGLWYRIGGVSLHLLLAGWTAADDGTHVAFWADDVYRTAQLLENADVVVSWDEMPPQGIDRFYVRDPSGNLLEIRGRDHSP